MKKHSDKKVVYAAMDVEFVDGLSTDEVEIAVDEIEQRTKKAVPSVTKIYVEAEAIKKIASVETDDSTSLQQEEKGL